MHISDGIFLSPQDSRIGSKTGRFRRIKAALVLALLVCILDVTCSFGASNQISVAPAPIDFGTQAVNTSAHSTITVENIGTHVVHIQSVRLSGSGVFRLRGWKGQIALEPSQSFTFAVIFKPSAQDSYSAILTIGYSGNRRSVTRVDGVGTGSTAAALSISPTTAVVRAGKSQQFTASLSDTGGSFGVKPRFSAASVEWLVNGKRGGSSLVGVISPSGLYTSPRHVSSGSSVTVSVADGISQANAQVTILPASTPVSVSISPANASVEVGQSKQFAATVSGATDVAVTWSVSGAGCSAAECGTISSGGLYLPPASVPAPAAVRVAVTSVADPSKSASATVAIVAAAAIVLSISPTAVSIPTAGTQPFTASVMGTSNTAVNWSLRGSGCSGSSCGTISSSSLSAIYSAPPVAPSSAGVSVTVTSVADSTKSASAKVNIVPSVVVSVTPPDDTLPTGSTLQFDASVTGTTNTDVTWSVSGSGCSGAACGTINSSGFYTAPTIVPSPTSVMVTATSMADPTKSSSAKVTVSPPTTVTVIVQPNGSTTAPYSPLRLLPGAAKRLYANVCNGSNSYGCTPPADITVTWEASCGALSTATGPYVDYTAPSSGGPCTITATNPPSKVTATATATLANPTVSIDAIPAALVLYNGQYTLLQAVVSGSVNRDVTWALASNPGGAGTLIPQGWTATFSASAQGTYTVKVISKADNTQVTTVTLYVTGNRMPATARVNKTEPVDCTATGSGTTYEVGPAQTYKRINAVPWYSLAAGDTVRIHNEGPAGNPTTYAEKWNLRNSGTASQPIRICGVPNSNNELPVISGNGATTSASYDYGIIEGDGLIIIYDRSAAYGDVASYPKHITIEGLAFTHVTSSYSYVPQAGGLAAWNAASAVWVQAGAHVILRGNDIQDTGQPYFINAQSPESRMTRWLLIQGNYIGNNGVVGAFKQHQTYAQSFGQVIQGNYYDEPKSGMLGSQIKTRCNMCFTRYNYISGMTAGARIFDVVAPEGSACLAMLQEFYYTTQASCGSTANSVAAAEDWYGTDYIYGNIMKFAYASRPVHYGDDNCAEDAHGGTLYFYHNTVWEAGTTNWRWQLLDTGPTGSNCNSTTPITRFPASRLTNNAIELSPVTISTPYFYWSDFYSGFVMLDTNWISASWGTGIGQGTDGNGTAYDTGTSLYQTANDAGHVTGIANLIAGGGMPFDPSSFAPASGSPLIGAAAALPGALSSALPVTMQYNPVTYLMSPRASSNDLGAVSH
jgi:hypothetical protein